MKKLIVLLSIMMLQLTAFSQKDTDTIPVKTFPIPTVKLIIKDIIVGDSAIAELKLTQTELELCNQYNINNRKIIDDFKNKYILCEETIKFEKEKYVILEKYSNVIQSELKKEKTNNKWLKIGSGSLIALLLTGLIIK